MSSSSLSNKYCRADRMLRDCPTGAAAQSPPVTVTVATMRSVLTGFGNEDVVLAVHDEVDLTAVPQPGVLFDEATVGEHPSIRVNLRAHRRTGWAIPRASAPVAGGMSAPRMSRQDHTGMDTDDAAGLTATVRTERSLNPDVHADQLSTGRKPCVDTSVAGHRFPPRTPRHPGLLEHDSQWPVFVRVPGEWKSP